jgi:hypothetical protein
MTPLKRNNPKAFTYRRPFHAMVRHDVERSMVLPLKNISVVMSVRTRAALGHISSIFTFLAYLDS